MRLDINLACQPYEDARQFWVRWGTAVGLAGLFTLVLLVMTITGGVNAHRDHTTMAKIRQQIADRDHRREAAEQILNLPQNRTTRDESRVLNELIERKAFSWTLVLENLEKVMPTRVHLVSISPELDEDNQLALKMVVAGDLRERAMELVRRMEDSRRFAETKIVDERSMQTTTGDTEQFDILALYIPETVPETTPGIKTNKAKTESKSTTESAASASTTADPAAPAPVRNPSGTKPAGKRKH